MGQLLFVRFEKGSFVLRLQRVSDRFVLFWHHDELFGHQPLTLTSL